MQNLYDKAENLTKIKASCAKRRFSLLWLGDIYLQLIKLLLVYQ